jgi:hypothetical protein
MPLALASEGQGARDMGFDGFFLSPISFGKKFRHEIVASCRLRVQRKSLTHNSQLTTQFAHRLKSVAAITKPAKAG